VESLDMTPFGDAFRGRRVLVTGHTGFKGSWLGAWLTELGAKVTGFALSPPTTPNHWDLLQLPVTDWRGDIRNNAAVQETIERCRPEIIFHLCAQALVSRSYRDPLESWSTNVMGTANILEACRKKPSIVRAIVVVTSDKVYSNNQSTDAYKEDDRLGGHDPYSASKAASELVVESYRKSFFVDESAPLVATARAGNVIGGGDWSEDRLIPDVIRALKRNESAAIRFPNATRPWQHVLDCLGGYLLLGQHLLTGKRDFAQAWNFGPASEDNRPVCSLLGTLQQYWPDIRWHRCEVTVHESKFLNVDSSKARSHLGWKPVWNLQTALKLTAAWYQEHNVTQRPLTHEQITGYMSTAAELGCSWLTS
jgi:CDP-glucose 4,6-dehydratase